MAFDGRLDNWDELADRIGAPRGAATARLLVLAWAHAGERCLDWIVGDFALAVFDAASQSLTLARDPTGQAPLHYVAGNGIRAFASMPATLVPLLGRRAVDKQSLVLAACQQLPRGHRSYFEGVKRIKPGEVVRLDEARTIHRTYWTPGAPFDAGIRTADLIDEYRSVLNSAVASQIKGHSLVATHLSSGYDSSAVTATAAKLLPSDRLIAFTSAPATDVRIPSALRRLADESAIAAETATACGIRHAVVRNVPPLADVMRQQLFSCQEPLMAIPNMAWWDQIRRQAAGTGATCLLTATLGNATLNAGGLYVLSEWLHRRDYGTWWTQARLAASHSGARWRGIMFSSFSPWMPPGLAAAFRRIFIGARRVDDAPFVRPEWRARMREGLANEEWDSTLLSERLRLLHINDPGLLRKSSLAEHGIEEVDPMSDRRLLDFSVRLPPEQLYWNGISRPLARAALSDRLPPAVINLPRRGLQAADWAIRFGPKQAREVLEEIAPSATARDLLDLPRIEKAIARWPTRQTNSWSAITEFRTSLLGALVLGMFALVHERSSLAALDF